MERIDKDAITEIIDILARFNKHFTELSVFLTEKQNKVLKDDMEWLNKSLSEEQALTMKSSSLETARLRLMDELGLKGYTSSRLLDECPEEYKGRLRLEVVNMERHMDNIKKLNADTLDTIGRKLSAAEDFLRSKGASGTDFYGEKGKKIRLHNVGNDIIGTL